VEFNDAVHDDYHEYDGSGAEHQLHPNRVPRAIPTSCTRYWVSIRNGRISGGGTNDGRSSPCSRPGLSGKRERLIVDYIAFRDFERAVANTDKT
jgi:hypothetical protein